MFYIFGLSILVAWTVLAVINPPSVITARPATSSSDFFEGPTDLDANFVASNKVALSWVSHSGGQETGFRIEAALPTIPWQTPTTGWKEVASVGKNVTNCTITSTLSTSYFYRVRAHIYTAYTPTVVASATNSGVLLSWQNNSDSPSETCVERKFSTNAWKQVAVIPYTIGTYFDTNIVWATEYSYRVRAHAYSAYSESRYVLPAPANLRATNICFDSVTLVWDFPDELTNKVNFIIERRDGETGEWFTVGIITNDPSIPIPPDLQSIQQP